MQVRVINSINLYDNSEILFAGYFLKIKDDDFEKVIKKISQQESIMHQRIESIIEKN